MSIRMRTESLLNPIFIGMIGALILMAGAITITEIGMPHDDRIDQIDIGGPYVVISPATQGDHTALTIGVVTAVIGALIILSALILTIWRKKHEQVNINGQDDDV